MSRMNSVDKKKALTFHKEKLLDELKYYEKRIEEAKLNQRSNFEYDGSSDSDSDLCNPLDVGPSVTTLKIQQSALQTCLNATQELTGLQVLQSEVNVLVDDPVLDGEPQVREDGIWREVTVECRVDLVPFSMMFYVHQPNRRFGPPSYRCLRAVAVKKAHESELNKSVLVDLTTPSDAFELFKSYAAAHRSRRTTLARLAEKYGESLYMAPMAEGGYQLKCANLLEISWMLQNRSSAIAPFHHRMKFDLEYMDESYIKTVAQAHKQLSNPSLETDERTMLLSKIISTCLEAQGINNSVQESTESESDTIRIQKRLTTLDQEPEMPLPKKKKEDSEVMAPPKKLPKKIKPKGKENNSENPMTGKTAKITNNEIRNDNNKGTKAKNDLREKINEPKNVVNAKKTTNEVSHANVNRESKQIDVPEKSLDHMSKGTKNKEANIKNTKSKEHKIVDRSNNAAGSKNNQKEDLEVCKITQSEEKEITEKPKHFREGNDKKIDKGKKIASDKKIVPQKSKIDKKEKTEKTSKTVETDTNVASAKNTVSKQHTRINMNKEVSEKIERKQKVGNPITNHIVNSVNKNKITVATDNKTKSKAIKNSTIAKSKEEKKEINTTESIKDTALDRAEHNNEATTFRHNKETGNTNSTQSQHPQTKSKLQSITKSMNSRFLNAPKFDKRNAMHLQKSTKIPQKKLSLSAEKIMKKNPLRISPRKSVSKLNTVSSQGSVQSKGNVRKVNTNIPRLVKKSFTKTKS